MQSNSANNISREVVQNSTLFTDSLEVQTQGTFLDIEVWTTSYLNVTESAKNENVQNLCQCLCGHSKNIKTFFRELILQL